MSATIPFALLTDAPPSVDWSAAVDTIRARAYVAAEGSLSRSLANLIEDRCRASFALMDAETTLQDAARGTDAKTRRAIRAAIRHLHTADDLIGRSQGVILSAAAAMGASR